MARHRSPKGRRAHLTPPLSALAAAGAGGVHRTIPVSPLTSSLPVRFVATAVASGALAAVGQHALTQTLPVTHDANLLRLGVEEIFGTDPAPVAEPTAAAVAPPVAAPLAALAPVEATPAAPTTAVAEAAELVKASDIQRQLTDAGVRAAAEQARAAEAAARAAAAEQAAPKESTAGQPAPGKPDTSSLSDSSIQMVNGRVTSGFGSRWGTRHQGLDIAAPIGTPIRVPFAGTVVDSGPASGFGLWVRVRHGDGTVTTYGHINRAFVREGQQVQAGQKIAEVGNRGHSTGPHLHIEVTTPGGAKINPRPWLDRYGVGY